MELYAIFVYKIKSPFLCTKLSDRFSIHINYLKQITKTSSNINKFNRQYFIVKKKNHKIKIQKDVITIKIVLFQQKKKYTQFNKNNKKIKYPKNIITN